MSLLWTTFPSCAEPSFLFAIGELFDYIVVRTKLSEKEGRKFLRQILLGLRYCHARGIVHRDLKVGGIAGQNHLKYAYVRLIVRLKAEV